MCQELIEFSQAEYCRVLNNHSGRQLSNADCIKILMQHGASYNQAKNGAYIYLHHGSHLIASHKGKQEDYNKLLDNINGYSLSNMECIRYLENLGFSQGQARSAAYNYRRAKNLIK